MRRSRRGRRSAEPLQAKSGPAPEQPRREAAWGLRRHCRQRTTLAVGASSARSAPPARQPSGNTATMLRRNDTRRARRVSTDTSGSDPVGKTPIAWNGIETSGLLDAPGAPGVNKQLEGKRGDKTKAQTSSKRRCPDQLAATACRWLQGLARAAEVHTGDNNRSGAPARAVGRLGPRVRLRSRNARRRVRRIGVGVPGRQDNSCATGRRRAVHRLSAREERPAAGAAAVAGGDLAIAGRVPKLDAGAARRQRRHARHLSGDPGRPLGVAWR